MQQRRRSSPSRAVRKLAARASGRSGFFSGKAAQLNATSDDDDGDEKRNVTFDGDSHFSSSEGRAPLLPHQHERDAMDDDSGGAASAGERGSSAAQHHAAHRGASARKRWSNVAKLYGVAGALRIATPRDGGAPRYADDCIGATDGDDGSGRASHHGGRPATERCDSRPVSGAPSPVAAFERSRA